MIPDIGYRVFDVLGDGILIRGLFVENVIKFIEARESLNFNIPLA
jgi:hypothetical protein